MSGFDHSYQFLTTTSLHCVCSVAELCGCQGWEEINSDTITVTRTETIIQYMGLYGAATPLYAGPLVACYLFVSLQMAAIKQTIFSCFCCCLVNSVNSGSVSRHLAPPQLGSGDLTTVHSYHQIRGQWTQAYIQKTL